MRRFPLSALLGCTTCAVLLVGCQSPVAPPWPPPPITQQALSVEIGGPSRIDAKGLFSWEAFAFGGSGEYHYRWEITGQVGQPRIERKLSLFVADTDGDMVLKLTVTSGNETRVETFGVRNCIGGCDARP